MYIRGLLQDYIFINNPHGIFSPKNRLGRWSAFDIPFCTHIFGLNTFFGFDIINSMPIVRSFNSNFFDTWTPEMAYVLGFVIADGYVFVNPRGSHYLGIVSTDLEIIQKIKTALNSNHSIGIRIPKNSTWKPQYVLQIGSKALVQGLKRYGVVQNKSLMLQFPTSLPEKILGHFIRGYFDGDGCIYVGRHAAKDRQQSRIVIQTRFTSGSKTFLNELKKRLGRHTSGGFIYSKNKSTNGTHRGYELCYSHRGTLALYHLMYNNTGPGQLMLTRKFRTFQKAIPHLRP